MRKVLTVVRAMQHVSTWWEASAAHALMALAEMGYNVKVSTFGEKQPGNCTSMNFWSERNEMKNSVRKVLSWSHFVFCAN